jgi:hypothetical protein
MSSKPIPARELSFHPLTPERWRDLERLCGERGASGGCWCMRWRIRRHAKQKGAGTKRAFRRIVEREEPPGLLAYASKNAIGWCAIAPRESYPVLENSRVLKRVDNQPVCLLFVFSLPGIFDARVLASRFFAPPFNMRGDAVLLSSKVIRSNRGPPTCLLCLPIREHRLLS